MTQSALIIVDMVNDFVTGIFGSEQARKTTEKAASVLSEVEGKIPFVFTMDSHIPDDPEFKVWGEHCLEGTEGSLLYPALTHFSGNRLKKRHFDSFYDSDLDGLLRARGVDHVYICGISTDICVLHTASGAFFRYYAISVIGDMCASIDPERHNSALESMRRNYGARVIGSYDFKQEVERHEEFKNQS